MSLPKLLPVALDVRGKPCLVVGGGAVAARKAKSLLECGARVKVVAIRLAPEFDTLCETCEISERAFTEADCIGCALVFACTDSPAVNEQVVAAARAAGGWCNVADGTDGDFQVMAAVRRGAATIAVSTGGGSPAMARHLKERVAAAVGAEYGVLLEIMGARRGQLKESVDEQGVRAGLWREVLESDALHLLREDRRADAERLIDAILKRNQE